MAGNNRDRNGWRRIIPPKRDLDQGLKTPATFGQA